MADCNTQHTAQFGILNSLANVTLVTGWIQGLCSTKTLPRIPADYLRDTGVLMLPISPNPGSSAYWNDLCRDLGKKIAVTDGSIAVKVRKPDGSEQDIRQIIDPSPPGQFKPNYLFALTKVTGVLSLDGNPEDSFRLVPFTDELFLAD